MRKGILVLMFGISLCMSAFTVNAEDLTGFNGNDYDVQSEEIEPSESDLENQTESGFSDDVDVSEEYTEDSGNGDSGEVYENYEKGSNLRSIMKQYADEGMVGGPTPSMGIFEIMIMYATSAVIIILFSVTFLFTALDLLYITVPPLRNVLYKQVQQGVGGMNNMNGGQGRMSVSQNAGSNGDGSGGVGSNTSGGTQKEKPFLSGDMVQFIKSGIFGSMSSSNFLKFYFKKRVATMILIVICVMLLIGSSVISDFGLNVGGFIINLFKSITQ